MKILTTTIFATSALVAGVGQSALADDEGRYAVKGAGAATCATFARELNEQSTEARLMLSWVAGYLSAYNRLSPETFDMVSWQSDGLMATSLQTYCAQNPEDPLHAVVEAMMIELKDSRVQTKSELIDIEVGNRKRTMYQSVLIRMQEQLKAEGHTLDVTGAFDKETRSAISGYQSKIGYRATGYPDGATLTKLFVN